MLVGKGQLLDLRVVKFAQQAVEMYAGEYVQSTCCKGVHIVYRLPWPNRASSSCASNALGWSRLIPGRV